MGFPYDQVDDATMLDDAKGHEADALNPPGFVKCRAGCGWYLGFPHDRDCTGTAGRLPVQPIT